ncbi:hypothetical protein ColLi_09158 [Colletotrichum liriopes]|uniref:Uncharacterized protein n=1 Tax=Colletotrichum liriopes TaxID=708192 RepID=A0AA37LUX8_9PEZI|nr:hypothetical protein ColLi_09158 [Colletotrichum liriopes]
MALASQLGAAGQFPVHTEGHVQSHPPGHLGDPNQGQSTICLAGQVEKIELNQDHGRDKMESA